MDRSLDTDTDRPWSTANVESGEQYVDRLVAALGTYRQRCVLYQLLDETPTSLDELADGVAAMETGWLSDEIPSEISDTVKVELHHQTLPKLAELNVIEYDPQSKTVSYHQPLRHIEQFLDLTRELDPVSDE